MRAPSDGSADFTGIISCWAVANGSSGACRKAGFLAACGPDDEVAMMNYLPEGQTKRHEMNQGHYLGFLWCVFALFSAVDAAYSLLLPLSVSLSLCLLSLKDKVERSLFAGKILEGQRWSMFSA